MRHLRLVIISVLLVTCGGQDDRAAREADQFIAQRQYGNARAVIEQALRADPKNVKLLRLQTRYFLCTEQVAFSVAAYRKLLAAQPGDRVLHRALDDPAPAVRVTAARVFGELRGPDALAALTKAAADREQSVRLAVTRALDRLDTPGAIPILGKLLHDRDWFVRGNAALALGKIGNADSVGALFKSLDDPDPYVRNSARLALRRLATAAHRPAYRAALAGQSPAARVLAALLLADADPAAVAPILIAELNRPEHPDLPEIIQTLAKIKAPGALPGLQKAAFSPDRNISVNAILALGDYRDQGSVKLLNRLRQNPQTDREVKTACLVALDRIGKK
ncbi:MAG: HEAT repeat domain-containing protein [Verrucomicrobiales bacterium]|jgi:HEAT repeat protein|nr:HEAT repeat domain-containing protein [Verrucomicrobiales bacterium]